MGEAVWGQRARPLPSSAASAGVWWEPAAVADVTAHRRELAATLRGALPPHADEDAVERLLLVFEELVSNGLRHGVGPVRVEVTTYGRFWLVDVSDAAVDRPPIPAVGRDAARGGLGLYLVARVCAAHGWAEAGARKHVWARVDFAPADATEAGPELIPRPRGESAEAAPSPDPTRS